MAAPLGGSAGARDCPTPYVEDVDDGTRPPQGEGGGSRFRLLSKHAFVLVRDHIDSSNCPHGVPNMAP
jgi:hypothetical protein